jgi:hypothetical protein
MFILREARLLFNIFPDFPEAFESKLLNMVETANEDGLYVVLAILRNYKGRPVIHRVCRALIERLPLDSEFLNEIEFALMQEDIVSGEFGFVDAYKAKREEVLIWLEDESEKVRNFAKRYIAHLDSQIITEQKRAEENLELRKFQYGESTD